jgi:hypothetical protein
MRRTFFVAAILCASLLPIGAFSRPGVAGVRRQDANQDNRGAEAARSLGSRDPAVRQKGAETLARIVAQEQRTLVEGYRLQEKDAKVRLALDWALYRMGKNEALFSIVKELESNRQSQSVGYLSQLESPQPLYVFIGRGKPEMQVGLLEVFARLGDEETLNVVKNYVDSPFPKVSKAAERARDQISFRLAQKPLEEKTRARRAESPGKSENP